MTRIVHWNDFSYARVDAGGKVPDQASSGAGARYLVENITASTAKLRHERAPDAHL
jgi:hypothetical protein